jgi:TPR repeat protein
MGWFNFKKEKSPDEKAIDLLAQKIFPGGDPERITRASVVSGICGHKLDFKEAVYVYSKIKGNFEIAVTLFDGVTKKGISAEQLVQDAIKDSQGKLNYFEAVAVVSYALFGREESSLVNFETLKTYLAGLFGSDEQGYDADVIPFAIGEFGLEPTNPVPVRGIGGSRAYLDKLRLAGGQPVASKRIRALKVADANIMVDEYEIFDGQNRLVCKLYICPYHQRVSCKAPRGFTIQNMASPSVPSAPPVLNHEGEAISQFTLGVRYLNGNGVAKDLVEAVKLFRKAADQGYAHAQSVLGACYMAGQGVTRDYAEAIKWFRKAADQGDADAQCRLGFICYEFQQDYALAVKWFHEATEQNFADAQYWLGFCYDNGRGVTKDHVEAAKWFRKAAEQNHAKAQYWLGYCYYIGQGVPKDYAEAVKWSHKAANQGDVDAQFRLGMCYNAGEGVTKDLVEAAKWWNLASAQGEKLAKRNLFVIEQKMTPEQIAEAQQLAREFQPHKACN